MLGVVEVCPDCRSGVSGAVEIGATEERQNWNTAILGKRLGNKIEPFVVKKKKFKKGQGSDLLPTSVFNSCHGGAGYRKGWTKS